MTFLVEPPLSLRRNPFNQRRSRSVSVGFVSKSFESMYCIESGRSTEYFSCECRKEGRKQPKIKMGFQHTSASAGAGRLVECGAVAMKFQGPNGRSESE